jgi:hypothetical protein
VAYQTAAQIRAAAGTTLSDAAKFTDQTLSDLISEFEELAESYCGVAFEPRNQTDTLQLRSTTTRLLVRPQLRSVTSLSVDGAAVTVGNLVLDKPIGSIKYDAGFPCESTVVIVYAHGFDAPTKGCLRACRLYVRSCALSDQSGVSRDVIATSHDGTTDRYSTPDWAARRATGYTEVDRLLNQLPNYRMPGVA